jgi:putative membrane protein
MSLGHANMPDNDRRIAQQAEKVHASAAHLERSATAVEQSVDRNTQLAANRTVLAAERTYAAWVRTALASLASGVGARALLSGLMPEWLVLVAGSALIIFSVFCLWAGVWRELRPGASPPTPDVHRLPTSVLIAINVLLTVVAIAALIGIWLYKSPSVAGQLPTMVY